MKITVYNKEDDLPISHKRVKAITIETQNNKFDIYACPDGDLDFVKSPKESHKAITINHLTSDIITNMKAKSYDVMNIATKYQGNPKVEKLVHYHLKDNGKINWI